MFIRLLSIIHTAFLRLKGISIGKNSIVYFRSSIVSREPCKVRIGKNCLIGRSKHGYHAGMPFYTTLLNDGNNSIITIGNNCRINGAYIHAQSNISIGDNCVIASGVSIMDSNGHQVLSFNRTKGRDISRPISIGNNVWIGLNAIILKDTVIGDNCIVSAGSVVKGTFVSGSIISSHTVSSIPLNLDLFYGTGFGSES